MSSFWRFLGVLVIVIGLPIYYYACRPSTSVIWSPITFIILFTGIQLLLSTPNGKPLSEKDLVAGRYYRVIGRCHIKGTIYAVLKTCWLPVWPDSRFYIVESCAVPEVPIVQCVRQNKKKVLVPRA